MTAAEHTAGVVPAVNDLLAGLIIVALYVVRVGAVAEPGGAWLGLRLVADVVVPVLAAVWLLVVPTYRVYRRFCSE